ncbi:PREDICTED: uncharacterized protein LOC104801070 isoform X1 [Tarenaya hassleriana]|uniref:uncharacterized protein LOC104801070 isoform X1 n=1 Tax=Tarenaya hassleriana TaxID=28532 RepID=UPI00053C50FE|nr:PREDICTED: uncharacterized protein LOC104801070 isoform X1 [Tarenaya hassleriana]XP_010522457.1 PREDICTED: uncharacterized protein LOC104801070 isoform X1 [Tarenaya hassleriana]XP_010522458.1 PREDICTED: uncharacterized protein LOC104801070 isoform X1 [Tarenaya hassleriana]
MGNDDFDAQRDDPGQEDPLLKMNNVKNLSGKDGLLKLQNSSSQQNTSVSSNGKWLQIVKNGHRGSLLHVTRIIDRKIPRHIVSLDEKYLRRCLELIHISASKSASCSLSVNFVGSVKTGISYYHLDSPVIPLADGSGSTVISPAVADYNRILDKPLLHKLGALDIYPSSTVRRKDEVKGSVSREISSSPSHFQLRDSHFWGYQSVSSSYSTCLSSELSSSSVSTTVSQGTLCVTMNENGFPRFVFSLDDRKPILVASLSNSEAGFDSDDLEYTYLIHLRKGNGHEWHLVGKIKVSTLFSVSSSSNSRIMEREFVLFSHCGDLQMQCHDARKAKGLPEKVVDAFRNTWASRQKSISTFSRASSIPEFCSRETSQEPNYDLEHANLLENDLPPNLESSAIVVKEQIQEETGGWGMKFFKKTSLPSTSMDVIIPSGIHGGPRKKNGGGGPSSLIKRWRSGGVCDCGGWDMGCPLTVLKGQPRRDQSEGQCNLFEFFTEGSKQGKPGVRIVKNVQDGMYFVQFQQKISILQSFSIAIAYIHSQSNEVCRSFSLQKRF